MGQSAGFGNGKPAAARATGRTLPVGRGWGRLLTNERGAGIVSTRRSGGRGVGASPMPAGYAISRRQFLSTSGSMIAGLSMAVPQAGGRETPPPPRIRFGIVADPHYADTPSRGARHYRESLAKMAECVAAMNARAVDFLIELGDLKDEADSASERQTLQFLKAIEGVLAGFNGPRYHVLGNHDADSIAKAQFLARIENTGLAPASGRYAFDRNGIHFVVLDANFRADGADYDHGNFDWTDSNLPAAELDWLRADLSAASRPTIVFVHQRLDGEGSHYVRNAAAVRGVLGEPSGVIAVFQGHDHGGGYRFLDGIHYCTLKAMVEGPGAANSAYALVEVFDDLRVAVTGFRREPSRELAPPAKSRFDAAEDSGILPG